MANNYRSMKKIRTHRKFSTPIIVDEPVKEEDPIEQINVEEVVFVQKDQIDVVETVLQPIELEKELEIIEEVPIFEEKVIEPVIVQEIKKEPVEIQCLPKQKTNKKVIISILTIGTILVILGTYLYLTT